MKEILNSVGIDIGTTTTQIVFSRIEIDNKAGSFAVPRFSITGRDIIYKSKIYFTPLLSENLIDGDALRKIVAEEYENAKIKAEDVSAGAVIITGETARKENASAVLRSLSDYVGDFVVATAGSDLEAVIAGKGSGAAAISKESGKSVMNFDVGGGTTNIAVFDNGELSDTACLDIGGRLVRLNQADMRVSYVAPKIKELAAEMSLDIKEGCITDVAELRKLVRRMAAFMDEISGFCARSKALSRMITAKELKTSAPPRLVTFSGGVAESIYNEVNPKDYFMYGDIGVLLGEAVRESLMYRSAGKVKPAETIRATVVGAGSHTVSVSGSTINYTENIFPLKNVPVIKVFYTTPGSLASSVKSKLKLFRTEEGYQRTAIGFKGIKSPSFDDLKAFAAEIANGISEPMRDWDGVIILLEEDMGKALGIALGGILPQKFNIVCLDNIHVEDGDYIDIGKPMGQGRVIPVVVKTLVFGA